ncbi:hypothetical protein PPL_02270 [Heterostelium album PN500]|uniref:F-box domain-containing protein n=1 Tax=Heterostelium pallidum (strain ATCC 26659 / Pp 5 / PN500) TaxID=670386 RepID=D3B1U6_HETP5|nr:hypothetical protein PPL_02270 [Heterostelium album PN500]EFA85270.1 hypothetical protein PPL_02270 [Heterostelium album PN500]|eukprot:XP_020437379.1 hypothetical protein PPL_02270 [Heterostelium album PN500]
MNNDNNCHIFDFDRLPLLILSKINSFLSDNQDRICFSLVCKRWFKDRDSYLWFNSDYLSIDSKDNLINNSYRNVISRSYIEKSNVSLWVGFEAKNRLSLKNTDILCDDQSDYYIPNEVSDLTIHYAIKKFLYNECFLKKLECSNVKFLEEFTNQGECKADRLPTNLKELAISNTALFPLLPFSSLTALNINLLMAERNNKPIKTSSLPKTLKSLTLGRNIKLEFDATLPSLEVLIQRDLHLNRGYEIKDLTMSTMPKLRKISVSPEWSPIISKLSTPTITTMVVHQSQDIVHDIPDSWASDRPMRLIENSLPNTLCELYLNKRYDKDYSYISIGSIPNSVELASISEKIPPSVTHISGFVEFFKANPIGELPATITTISITNIMKLRRITNDLFLMMCHNDESKFYFIDQSLLADRINRRNPFDIF